MELNCLLVVMLFTDMLSAVLCTYVGPDVVVWNLHRRYGQVRLPRLLEGWRQLEVIGWNEDLLTKEVSWMKTYEPVFVLKKQSKDEL